MKRAEEAKNVGIIAYLVQTPQRQFAFATLGEALARVRRNPLLPRYPVAICLSAHRKPLAGSPVPFTDPLVPPLEGDRARRPALFVLARPQEVAVLFARGAEAARSGRLRVCLINKQSADRFPAKSSARFTVVELSDGIRHARSSPGRLRR